MAVAARRNIVEYNLRLTDDEAVALARLLRHHVVGVIQGPRGALSDIGRALDGAVGPVEKFNTAPTGEFACHDRVRLEPDN